MRDAVGPRVQVASGSGGTDVASGFAGSAPTTDVWAGEISAPNLGVALAAWNDAGQPVTGQVGELVVTRPMPSMPLYFWNDPDGARYHDAYFDTFPGVWRHGDWMEVTERGSVIVSGRSDSTLNRNGVRLGSADIYAVVDQLPQLAESLVIGAELGDGGYWLALFVVLAPGATLDEELRRQIKSRNRRARLAPARPRRHHRGHRHPAHPHREEAGGPGQADHPGPSARAGRRPRRRRRLRRAHPVHRLHRHREGTPS